MISLHIALFVAFLVLNLVIVLQPIDRHPLRLLWALTLILATTWSLYGCGTVPLPAATQAAQLTAQIADFFRPRGVIPAEPGINQKELF